MARLQWDAVGSRTFETGVDRGVLYLPEGNSIPWNGLTGVEEDASDVVVGEYYIDGVKYLNKRSVGDFSANLRAYTYPDEFMRFDGISEIDTGLYAFDQPIKETFGLSYRTRLGNDLLGTDYGYKIHLLYNLTAKPSNKAYSSIGASIAGAEFSWTIQGVPPSIAGFRPTCHFIIDSTKLSSVALQVFEDALYGTDLTSGYLPDVEGLLAMHTNPVGPGGGIPDTITEPITDVFV